MGVISIGYIVNRFTEAVIQGYFQEGIRVSQRRRFVDSLTEHYILCGLVAPVVRLLRNLG
jgi:voltage-gated potassium channel